jgi:hypothetical protein
MLFLISHLSVSDFLWDVGIEMQSLTLGPSFRYIYYICVFIHTLF